MRPYDSLTGRGQLGRLRVLARAALAQYPGVRDGARLTPLRHEHNATFRVDGRGTSHLLRINRPDLHARATIESEMAWLVALRQDTDLRVPQPVAATDGSHLVTASDTGVPGARSCVLLGWIEGRHVDRRLTPQHLTRVGGMMAELQVHALGWTPPAGFGRPRLDGLTAAARRESVAGPAAPEPLVIPAIDDGARAVDMIETLLSRSEAAVAARAIAWAREATGALADRDGARGLIHGDLHQDNVLFTGDGVAAIDFDDCGWGFHLYDIAVPLSELTGRRRFPALRGAFLDAYVRRRSLPADVEPLLASLIAYRGLQLVIWILESREHAGFRDRWRDWAREELAWVAGRVDGGEPRADRRP